MKQHDEEVTSNGESPELEEEAPREEEGGGSDADGQAEATACRVSWQAFQAVCLAVGLECPERPQWVRGKFMRVELLPILTDRGQLAMVKSGKQGRHVFLR